MEGWVNSRGWLYTERVYLSADKSPSTNQFIVTQSHPRHNHSRHQCLTEYWYWQNSKVGLFGDNFETKAGIMLWFCSRPIHTWLVLRTHSTATLRISFWISHSLTSMDPLTGKTIAWPLLFLILGFIPICFNCTAML